MQDRVQIIRCGSPKLATMRPPGSTATMAPRCLPSTIDPLLISRSIGDGSPIFFLTPGSKFTLPLRRSSNPKAQNSSGGLQGVWFRSGTADKRFQFVVPALAKTVYDNNVLRPVEAPVLLAVLNDPRR